jgi:galactose mutarotase-like enzyme
MKGAIEINKESNIEIVSMTLGRQQVKIAVNAGNTLFSWKVRNKEKMWFPFTMEGYLKSNSLAGNPFMYPWANRLEMDALPFRHFQHSFQGAAVYRDGNGLPLHGLLLKSPYWQTIATEDNADSLMHRARLHFGDIEEYMQIFPVRHTIEMNHVLDENGLQIEVYIKNEDDTALPLSFGFHPYFSYLGTDKSRVRIKLPFQQHFKTNARLIPSGELEAVAEPLKEWFSIQHHPLDDGFTGIAQEPVMWLDVAGDKIAVDMGTEYKVGVVYAPSAEQKAYVCLEPMLAPTNALFLAIRKQWNGLRWLNKGDKYSAAFQLRAL